MKDFVELIKHLPISSLRDISRRINIPMYDKRNGSGERDYYVNSIINWKNKKAPIYNRLWFKIVFPILTGFLFFFIGRFSDISNKNLKSEFLGTGIPEVVFFLSPPIDTMVATFERSFPSMTPPPSLLSTRHGSLIIQSMNENYPIYDLNISVARAHDQTGVQIAEKYFGNISGPVNWYISNPLFQEFMNSKEVKSSSNFKLTHPEISADEILHYTISTRRGVYLQEDYFKLDSNNSLNYWIASRTFIKKIQNKKYVYTLIREKIDSSYPRTETGEIIDFQWNENLMMLSREHISEYDSVLNRIRGL